MTDPSRWPPENARRLLRVAVLAVMPRPTADIARALQARVFDDLRDRVWLVDGVNADISSSTLRSVCFASARVLSASSCSDCVHVCLPWIY
jgi:nicotinic acid mononucleotide adenylyltransferase